MRTTKHNGTSLYQGGFPMSKRVGKATLGLVAAAVLASGCAQSVGTIDRVQHNLVSKADLLYNADGSRREWYYRLTVVDAPYASAYSFVGDQGSLERGVFEVQEKYLYFHRIYTFTEGEYNDSPRHDVDVKLKCAADRTYCDANGNRRDSTVPCDCNGDYLLNGRPVWMDKNAPLLAFPIENHVDVIWEYNPMTGERTNVRVENETDRMWFEREYMRVSWGENHMLNFNSFSLITQPDGGSPSQDEETTESNPQLPLNPMIFKDESSSPDLEPRLDFANGYMDFTDDWLFTVQTEMYEGFGEIPLCWFYPWYAGGVYECVSERIRVRNAFLRVDPAREAAYRPVVHDDYDQARFGYFRSERATWDKYYGYTYSGMRRYAYAFDIFERDAQGNVTGVRPIVYYLNEGYPDDLVEEANEVARQWTEAFDAVVRGVTGQDPSAFGVDHVVVMCENNLTEYQARVKQNLPTAGVAAPCDVTHEPKRVGDLRYNFLHAVTGPTQVGLYGFGPMSADPLSGRIVTATAYNYVAAMREGANRALNRLEFLAGTRSFRELADARYISNEVKYDRLRDTYWRQGYTDQEAQAVASSLVSGEVQAALDEAGVQKTDQNVTQARLNRLANHPDIEALLIGDDVKLLFKDPRVGDRYPALTEAQRQRYAPRNWAHSGGVFQQGQKRIRADGERALDRAEYWDGALIRLSDFYKGEMDRAVCDSLKQKADEQAGKPGEPQVVYDFGAFGDQNPCTVEALTEQLRAKFAYVNQSNPYGYNKTFITTPFELDTKDPDLHFTQAATIRVLEGLRNQFAEELFKAIYLGVALHEVGHNLGLRHNFEASTDALNFPADWWRLKVKPAAGGGFEPVSLWGENSDQARGITPDGKAVGAGMRELQYSSVMDYFFKFNLPWHGIGLYDKAAIKYVYGGLMEVFATAPDTTGYQAYADADPAREDPGNVPSLRNRGEGLGRLLYVVHPTEYPNLWGDIAPMYARKDVKKADVLGVACGQEGAACGQGRVCKRFREGLRCSVPDTVVPYRFGGDELAGLLPTVDVWDEGVDPFEIASSFAETYEAWWVFAGYWHQDPTYWPSSYSNWVTRLFFNLRSQYQWWVLGYTAYNHHDFWKKRFGMRWEEDLNGGKAGAMASYLAFNTLAGAFGRPAATTYGYNQYRERYEMFDQVNMNNYLNQVVMLEEDGARPVYPYWDYDGYLPVVVSAGAIYDRIAAFEALADPEVWLAGVDTEADTQKYLVNFGTVFRKEMNELFGGLIANNASRYGWCVLEHTYQTKNKVGPVAFAPREYVAFGGQHLDCSTLYCGVVNEQADKATKVVRAPHPENPADPCGADLRAKGFVALNGKPIEPEELYIFPTTRYRVPMLAAYYGMSLLIDNFDRSFMDATRIWLKGNQYTITPPAGAEVIECEDRFSGRVYQAYRLPDGGYYPAYDLVYQCKVIFDCFDETVNKTLTDDQKQECMRLTNKAAAQIPTLTLDKLRAEYLFHDLQFLIGKLELVRAMHAEYEWE